MLIFKTNHHTDKIFASLTRYFSWATTRCLQQLTSLCKLISDSGNLINDSLEILSGIKDFYAKLYKRQGTKKLEKMP